MTTTINQQPLSQLSLILPWPPSKLNPNKRIHWAALASVKKKYKADCYNLTKQARIKIQWEGNIHLWLDFYPPSLARFDDDNLVAAFKAGRDGVAAAIGVDDCRFKIHLDIHRDEPVKFGCVRVSFSQTLMDAPHADMPCPAPIAWATCAL